MGRSLTLRLLRAFFSLPFWRVNVANAAEPTPGTKGLALLKENCGRCHSIQAKGNSPLKAAPPMRTIYMRIGPEELQAELAEGVLSMHKQMPQIQFSDEDVYAIMSFLYGIAANK